MKLNLLVSLPGVLYSLEKSWLTQLEAQTHTNPKQLDTTIPMVSWRNLMSKHGKCIQLISPADRKNTLHPLSHQGERDEDSTTLNLRERGQSNSFYSSVPWSWFMSAGGRLDSNEGKSPDLQSRSIINFSAESCVLRASPPWWGPRGRESILVLQGHAEKSTVNYS